MTDAELIERLKADLGDRIEIANPGRRRLYLKVAPENLVAVVTRLRDGFGVVFLSTISGVDMFGMTVDHIPDPRPLVLPDDWPAGNYPLRKDWKFERPEEVIPGGKS
jgi:NADH:ubiquinone oxidoreductase subunit C